MRICYLANANSIHTQRWVKYFASHGHEVHLISQMPFGGNNIENIKLYVLRRFSPRIPIISLLVNLLFNVIQVKRWVREIKPDILHAHYITTYGFLGALSGFHPLVLSAWGSDVLVAPKSSKINKAIVKFTLKEAEVVTCVSDTVKEELLRLGASLRTIVMISHGVDTQQFSPHQQDEDFRSRLGVRGTPTVICIRNLKPVYNVEMLIRAIPLVLRQMPEVKFIIAGEGEQRDYLKQLVNSLKVSENVRFVGWIPHNELPKYLASSDVYVSTSLSDGTSLSLQEAMACKLAPVVTDLPANREWIVDGKNGFIVPINDVPALASRIVYLLQNNETRKRFGEIGRKVIAERAEYKKEMAKMEKIYEGLRKERQR